MQTDQTLGTKIQVCPESEDFMVRKNLDPSKNANDKNAMRVLISWGKVKDFGVFLGMKVGEA